MGLSFYCPPLKTYKSGRDMHGGFNFDSLLRFRNVWHCLWSVACKCDLQEIPHAPTHSPTATHQPTHRNCVVGAPIEERSPIAGGAYASGAASDSVIGFTICARPRGFPSLVRLAESWVRGAPLRVCCQPRSDETHGDPFLSPRGRPSPAA